MDTKDLRAYKGEEPYIFVSYSHKDSPRVFPLLKVLQDAGYRIWFDHGIEAGTEWSNNIAEHLNGCSGFLAFVSLNSVASENCLDEMAYAKRYAKPALMAFLDEDAVLPVGTDMQTARFQRMFVNRQVSLDGFVENFSAATIFAICCDGKAPTIPAPQPMPVPPNAPKRQGSVNNLLLIGLSVVSLIAVVAVVLLLLRPGAAPRSESQPQTGQTTEPVTEPATEPTYTLSQSLSDHTFSLGGVVYRLPVAYETLAKDGWTLGQGALTTDTYIAGLSQVSTTLVNSGRYLEVEIYNDGENAKPLSQCHIGQITADEKGNTDFTIAGGFTVGATAEELIAVFGAPTTRNDYEDYSSLIWEMSEYSRMRAYCYHSNPYNAILISNYVRSTETFPVREEAPKYLDDYTAPEALGDDPRSGNISIDGIVYRLPVPLREFLGNGWVLSDGGNPVISGNTSDVTLEKEGRKLELQVTNLSAYKTKPENCTVSKLYANTDSAPEVLLGGGIRLGMDGSTIKGCLPEDMDVFEGSYSVTYSYTTSQDRDFYLKLSVDIETGVLEYIQLTEYLEELIIE